MNGKHENKFYDIYCNDLTKQLLYKPQTPVYYTHSTQYARGTGAHAVIIILVYTSTVEKMYGTQ